MPLLENGTKVQILHHMAPGEALGVPAEKIGTWRSAMRRAEKSLEHWYISERKDKEWFYIIRIG